MHLLPFLAQQTYLLLEAYMQEKPPGQLLEVTVHVMADEVPGDMYGQYPTGHSVPPEKI